MRRESKKTRFWRHMSWYGMFWTFPINLIEAGLAMCGSAVLFFATLGQKGKIGNILAWMLHLGMCGVSVFKLKAAMEKIDEICEDKHRDSLEQDLKTIRVVSDSSEE